MHPQNVPEFTLPRCHHKVLTAAKSRRPGALTHLCIIVVLPRLKVSATLQAAPNVPDYSPIYVPFLTYANAHWCYRQTTAPAGSSMGLSHQTLVYGLTTFYAPPSRFI